MGRIKLVQKQKTTNRLHLAQWGKIGGGIAACAYTVVMLVGNIGKTTDSAAGNVEQGKEIIYFENFDDYMNGVTESTLWETAGAEKASLSEDYFFEVRKGEFLARVDGTEKTWTSAQIDITQWRDVSITVDLAEKGKLHKPDYIHIFYQLDDGDVVPFDQHGQMEGEFNKAIAIQHEINGEKLQVMVRVKNNGFNESHTFDNVTVYGMAKEEKGIEASLQ